MTPSCCCSPKVARNICARSSSAPARLPNRSAPVSGFSNLGIRVPEFIAVIIPTLFDAPRPRKMHSTYPTDLSAQLRIVERFHHSDHRQRQTVLQRNLDPLDFPVAVDGI